VSSAGFQEPALTARPTPTRAQPAPRSGLQAHVPGSSQARPASAGLCSAWVRSREGQPGWIWSYRSALKATISATAAAATPHPSGSGPGAAL
jgi:hypothetical protein